ncbi:MAG TPA: amidohydrolase [Acidimicrobiia bacterium]|nr:amidohydrolase [Acidimicrobiia bacterium]
MRKLFSAEAVITSRGRVGNAILTESGTVVAIGERDDLVEPTIVEERYPGGFIIPGLRDAHLHAVPYATLLGGCSLKSASSIDDLVARLSAYASSRPTTEPIVATRLDDEGLAERRLPTREDLDRAVPDRPAVIYRYCGHVAVANSAALDASAISSATPDPPGGSLDRDEGGRPTGVLRETAAGLIASALSRGSRLHPDELIHGLERLAAVGLTSIGTMIGYGEAPSHKLEDEIDLWCEVGRRLPIRVYGIVITDDPDQLSRAAARLSGAGPRMRWIGVKRFADGSLGGHTAAMRAPFADVDTIGTYRLNDADAAICGESIRMGGMVAVHAIGDRAVSGVLDLFDGLIADGATPDRLRMEHASVIDPDQIRRFAGLGATACVQPAFLASESEWVAQRVGPDREPWLYPFRTMRDSGIPLAGSSDCPVEPPHPLWGMAAAIDRHGISPGERLTPLEALDLFTDGAAYALGEQAPLSIGAPADMVVIGVDVTTATPDEIRSAAVLSTYVDADAVTFDAHLPTWVD